MERATVAFLEEPQNIEEALTCENSKEWECAMREEYDSLMTKNTWTLVPLPAGRKPVSCKWVFKIKQGANGEVERYKARLVARGFTQTYGVDYNEMFAPVAKFTSIRCIFALAALEDMEIHRMDVKIAFLNGELEEEIYMEQPQGFMHQGSEHLVCKLQKSLYGLTTRKFYYSCMVISHFFASLPFNASSTAIRYIVFGAFIFIHLVVVHSKPHFALEQILVPKKSLL